MPILFKIVDLVYFTYRWNGRINTLNNLMQLSFNYFSALASLSTDFINSLPMELTPQPLEFTLKKLYNEVEKLRDTQICSFKNIEYDIIRRKMSGAQGLNTIGMLADRFSILIIREWCLRNKTRSIEKADSLFRTQTAEIMQAMEQAQPGYSSLNSKITKIKADAKASSWEEAYYGLLSTNLLLWESQEVLYIKDIQTLPAEEIREYIKWFSSGNILRNEYIELCENQYWSKF